MIRGWNGRALLVFTGFSVQADASFVEHMFYMLVLPCTPLHWAGCRVSHAEVSPRCSIREMVDWPKEEPQSPSRCNAIRLARHHPSVDCLCSAKEPCMAERGEEACQSTVVNYGCCDTFAATILLQLHTAPLWLGTLCLFAFWLKSRSLKVRGRFATARRLEKPRLSSRSLVLS